uniref:Putative lipocalin-2 1 n=1 Tax=Amblyomma americanum TaxID=6943 RepID=A0A0C9SEW2_AMBAM
MLGFFRPLSYISFFLLFVQCRPEETRIDTDVNYEKHQDIYRAFNITGFYWLYGFNFESEHTVGKSCVYFTVEHLYADRMYYASNFKKDGEWGKIEYNGTFYSTPVTENTKQKKSHCLQQSKSMD